MVAGGKDSHSSSHLVSVEQRFPWRYILITVLSLKTMSHQSNVVSAEAVMSSYAQHIEKHTKTKRSSASVRMHESVRVEGKEV